jgi:hypothetical protein
MCLQTSDSILTSASILPLDCVKIEFTPKQWFSNLYTCRMPHAVVKTQFYPAHHVLLAVTVSKHPLLNLYAVIDLHLSLLFCTGPIGILRSLQRTHPSRISHGTDKIMTHYDTGRTEFPFGQFDVCIWVGHFLVQDSPIEGTPH